MNGRILENASFRRKKSSCFSSIFVNFVEFSTKFTLKTTYRRSPLHLGNQILKIKSLLSLPSLYKYQLLFHSNYHLNHNFFIVSVTPLQKLVPQPAPVSNNVCFFDGFGEVTDPSSCGSYFACTNTRSIQMNCPAGLHFRPISEKKGICDYPRNVKCTGKGVRS